MKATRRLSRFFKPGRKSSQEGSTDDEKQMRSQEVVRSPTSPSYPGREKSDSGDIHGNPMTQNTHNGNSPSTQGENQGEFKETWDRVMGGPILPSKGQQRLDGIEGLVIKNGSQGAGALDQVAAITQAVGSIDAVQEGIDHFLEGSKVLMDVLDEVAHIHPFVSVAVSTFRIVLSMEMQRRQNNSRVRALYATMKEMMQVLVQLKHIKDVKDIGPNGETIEGRMRELSNTTAKDIKACANECDIYSKKKLVVKVVCGAIWEPRLEKYFTTFSTRRRDFELALSIHTARGVDETNAVVKGLTETSRLANEKMDRLLQMFQNFIPPEQQELAQYIEKKGGFQALQESDEVLEQVYRYEEKIAPAKTSLAPVAIDILSSGGSRNSRGPQGTTLDHLREDLLASADDAVTKNMEIFEKKFNIHSRQIKAELDRTVRREGDRILAALASGPYDKIIDPDIYTVWKEMGWHGSVKPRQFVVALRDYFTDKWAEPMKEGDPRREDEWALVYLDPSKVQPISEAFDDDASGFVTISEVNAFRRSRPVGWSLLHWIAYWAAGWQLTQLDYSAKINTLLSKMFAIVPHIDQRNRNEAIKYLGYVYQPVACITHSVNNVDTDPSLRDRFQSYVDLEEKRLRENLRDIDYDIDGVETVPLVTGPGRIEKYIMPLLYLLLERHFEIFRVAQTKKLHHDELFDAMDTLFRVLDVFYSRMKLLKNVFTQQKLNEKEHFKVFAHGLFEYSYDQSKFFAVAREMDPGDLLYNENLESKELDPKKICNYPLDERDFDFVEYKEETVPSPVKNLADATGFSILESILGTWNGLLYYDEGKSSVFSITLSTKEADEKNGTLEFRSYGLSSRGHHVTTKGTCRLGETPHLVIFEAKRIFMTRHATQYWTGEYDLRKGTISGQVSLEEGPDAPCRCTFFLSRTPRQYLRHRPTARQLEKDKARSFWNFAISAIQAEVHQRLSFKSFLNERRVEKERYIELRLRQEYDKSLSPDEQREIFSIENNISPADIRCYNSLGRARMNLRTYHGSYSCDACDCLVVGTRIVCLDCTSKEPFKMINLCEEAGCLDVSVSREDLLRAHNAAHDLLKVRYPLFTREQGKRQRLAKQALARSRDIMDKYESSLKEGAMPTTGDDAVWISVPSCIVCHKTVMQPCWFCTRCEDEVFICMSCDQQNEVAFANYHGHHDYHTHDLVRCQKARGDDDELPVEERLGNLEAMFTTKFTTQEAAIKDLQDALHERLGRVEEMIQLMLTGKGLGNGLSPNSP